MAARTKARGWRPSPAQRKQIQTMSGYGMPEPVIARLFGVDEKTLKERCGEELASGVALANAKAAEFLFRQFAPMPGQVVPDPRTATQAAIFWLKTRAQWRESVEVTGDPERPIEHRVSDARQRLYEELDRMATRGRPVAGGPAGAAAEGMARPSAKETVH